MEQHVAWVVQFWIVGYGYWTDCAVPAETLFGLPQVGYENEQDARHLLEERRSMYPAGEYRLIKRTITVEVVA